MSIRLELEKAGSGQLSNESVAMGDKSGDCSNALGTPTVTESKGELNENDSAGGGDRRKDVLAEAIMPEFVHRPT